MHASYDRQMKCEISDFIFDYELLHKMRMRINICAFGSYWRNLYKKRMIRPIQVSFEICLCGEQHQHEGALSLFSFCFTCCWLKLFYVWLSFWSFNQLVLWWRRRRIEEKKKFEEKMTRIHLKHEMHFSSVWNDCKKCISIFKKICF